MTGRTSQTQGFVLRSVEYGERDLVVTLYTQAFGKCSAIAKNARGSKRRFGGGLQPMRMLELTLTRKPNRDLHRLDEIEVLEDYHAIEKSYDKIALASYATDLFRCTTVEEDPESGAFELLEDFYERLARSDPSPAVLGVLLGHFQLRLFEHGGRAPALDRCLRCGTSTGALAKVYALRSGEGILCPSCVRTGEGVGVLYPETLDVLRYFRAPHGEVPDALENPTHLEQARRFVRAAEERILDGKKLKSRAALESVFETPRRET